MNVTAFHLTCRHCRAALFTLGPRLSDDALCMLAEHVRQVHPDVALPADVQAGAVLARFDVTPTDAL